MRCKEDGCTLGESGRHVGHGCGCKCHEADGSRLKIEWDGPFSKRVVLDGDIVAIYGVVGMSPGKLQIYDAINNGNDVVCFIKILEKALNEKAEFEKVERGF